MTLYDPEPPDSHAPSLAEVGAVVCLLVGAVCAVTTGVLWRKWKP